MRQDAQVFAAVRYAVHARIRYQPKSLGRSTATLRVSVAEPSEQQKRGYEPRVEVALRRTGPAQQLGVHRPVEVELGGRLGDCCAVPAGDDRAVRRGPEDLDRVVQRRLLADHDAADREAGVQCKLPKVLEEVALAGSEPAAEKHAPSGTVPGPLDQRQEPVLDLRLSAAEQPDRVPGRHAGPQGLQGPPLPGHQVDAMVATLTGPPPAGR